MKLEFRFARAVLAAALALTLVPPAFSTETVEPLAPLSWAAAAPAGDRVASENCEGPGCALLNSVLPRVGAVSPCFAGTPAQQAYVKASNTGAVDGFSQVAISSDGNTLAVGAYSEDSALTGVTAGSPSNAVTGDGAADSGAVYVFIRTDAGWSQQAYIKASNTGAGDLFGYSVALSGDGNTLAVGANEEDSALTGVTAGSPNEAATGNAAGTSGAAYVFTRAGATWTQQAYVKASNTGAGDQFGFSVSLSTDGNTLAVGAEKEDSALTGVTAGSPNEAATGNAAADSGTVYVFTRTGGVWSQQVYVKASNTEAGDEFGTGVALSSDGNTLAVSAIYEDSALTGVTAGSPNEATTGNGAIDRAGAVYVFTRAGATWTQQAYVKASNTGAGDQFGTVALSSDGNTLAVGAQNEDSALTGVTAGSPTNATTGDGAADAGAVYVLFGPGSGDGDSGGPSIGVTINGSSSPEVLIAESPQGATVRLEIEVSEIEGKELFFVLNAPALGIYWSYLNSKNQWVAVPTNWAAIQPFGLAPPNGRHSLFGTQTLPAGTYEFYLGFDERVDGFLNIVAGGVLGKFVQRTVQVQ